MASGRISSRCSARCRSVVRQDRCGRCGSVRQLGPDLLQVLDQEAAEVLPESTRSMWSVWSVWICSMASGRISFKCSARWRPRFCRDRRGWRGRCGRCGSVRQLGPDLLHVLDHEAAEVLPGSARLARICSAARAGSPPGVRPGGGRGSAEIGAVGVVGVDLIDGPGRISSRCSARWRSRFCRDRRGWRGRRGSDRWLPVGSPPGIRPGVRPGGGRWFAGISAAGADLIDGFRADLFQVFGQVSVGGSPG